jgi:anti-sigma factor RsiW
MTKPLPLRDLETLSAYLDGQLSPRHTRKLESRLKQEPNLQRAFTELQQTRLALRSIPRVRAPRNFSLTPEMAKGLAGKRATAWRGFQTMRLVAVAASVVFAVIFAGDLLLGGRIQSKTALAPAAEPAAEMYAMDEAAAEAAGEAEAPMSMEALQTEAPQGRAVSTEVGIGGGAPAETEVLEAALPKAIAEETAGEDMVGGSMNAAEMTETPTSMGTPIPPGETEAPAEPPPSALDTTQTQIIETTVEPAPQAEAAPLEGQTAAIEEEENAVEAPGEVVEPRVQLPVIRIVEGGLLLVALLSGGLAIYLRHRGG